MAWMINYILQFYLDVITYSCPNNNGTKVQLRILPAHGRLAAVPGVWYHTVSANIRFMTEGWWPSG